MNKKCSAQTQLLVICGVQALTTAFQVISKVTAKIETDAREFCSFVEHHE